MLNTNILLFVKNVTSENQIVTKCYLPTQKFLKIFPNTSLGVI